jgi:hypothetical protein
VSRGRPAASVSGSGPATAYSGPAIGAAFRAAANDFYYQSIRLVPVNVAWGAAFVALLAVAAWVSPLVALVGAVLLALPAVSIYGLAAQIVRGEDVVLSDAAAAIRRHGLPALVCAAAMLGASVICGTNLAAGVAAGGPLGWSFATLAGWGLIATWLIGLAFWALLVDPARARTGPLQKARLAALVVLAHPLRFAGFGLTVVAVLIVSTIAFVALVTVSVAYVALASARFVLPAADRLETRLDREPVPDRA